MAEGARPGRPRGGPGVGAKTYATMMRGEARERRGRREKERERGRREERERGGERRTKGGEERKEAGGGGVTEAHLAKNRERGDMVKKPERMGRENSREVGRR